MLNFLFKSKQNQVGNITLDALLVQDVVMENVVTARPLETGELLNDAIHNLPLKIYIEGVVTDLEQFNKENSNKKTEEILTDTKLLKTSKSLKAWSELLKLWKEKVLIKVTSPMQKEPFKDMAILRITPIQDGTDALVFRMDLQQVLVGDLLKNQQLAPEIGKQSERL